MCHLDISHSQGRPIYCRVNACTCHQNRKSLTIINLNSTMSFPVLKGSSILYNFRILKFYVALGCRGILILVTIELLFKPLPPESLEGLIIRDVMFAEILCREWNSIRVRFWSIGYKKRLFLSILVLLVLGCLAVWTSFFADLSDLNITQERQDGINDSSQWDQWVKENGLKAVGDIWDSCGEVAFENVFVINS